LITLPIGFIQTLFSINSKNPQYKLIMAKKPEKTIESAGNVDWERLESMPQNRKKTAEEFMDKEGIEAEKKNLTEQEKALPYPEDFLADINLMRKNISKESQNMPIHEEDEGDSFEEDEDFEDNDEVLYSPSPKKVAKTAKPKPAPEKNATKKPSRKR
jgi:hypothetical protein